MTDSNSESDKDLKSDSNGKPVRKKKSSIAVWLGVITLAVLALGFVVARDFGRLRNMFVSLDWLPLSAGQRSTADEVSLGATATNRADSGGGGSSVQDEAAREVVALVNGEQITRGQLDTRITRLGPLIEQLGQSDDSLGDQERSAKITAEVLDSLVNEALLFQEARKQGITPAKEDIEGQYQQFLGRFESEQALADQLAKQGSSIKLVKENIAHQLTIQEFVNRETSGQDLKVTDEEVREFYDQIKNQNEKVPALDEIRPQLTNQLTQQKTSQLVLALIDDLRGKADIEILLGPSSVRTGPNENTP